MDTRSKLVTQEAVEILHAVHREGVWHMTSGDVSHLWNLVVGDDWSDSIDDDYWGEFFRPFLKVLNSQTQKLVRMLVYVTYLHGVVTETEVRAYMDGWRSDRLTELGARIVRVSERIDNTRDVAICQMTVNRFEVERMEI